MADTMEAPKKRKKKASPIDSLLDGGLHFAIPNDPEPDNGITIKPNGNV